MIFAALLQVTPAASPDCNFMGLAAEEQDAEVTARRRTVVVRGSLGAFGAGRGCEWDGSCSGRSLLRGRCRAEGLPN